MSLLKSNKHYEDSLIVSLLDFLYNEEQLSKDDIKKIENKIDNNIDVEEIWLGMNMQKEDFGFQSKKEHLGYLKNSKEKVVNSINKGIQENNIYNDLNVLILGNDKVIKESIESRIKKVKPKSQCHFVSNAKLAISKMHEISIDLIFCDLEFSGETDIDGFYIIKSILKFEPKVKVIALTHYNSYRIMKKAMTIGFHSFLDKGCSFNEFSETLINVSVNGMYESPTMKRLLKKRNQFLSTTFSKSLYGISDLSPRELEFILLSAETINKLKLAEIMNVTPNIIDTYFDTVLSKLQLKYREELSLFSLECKDELLKLLNK
ncbi:MAG: response regulator [Flavobacteriaceae bacterium]|nr:MAG: response regulator [Flavobacteriaceae bacterium]